MQRHALASALFCTMAMAGCSTVGPDEARSAPDAGANAAPMPAAPPVREAAAAKMAGPAASATMRQRAQAAPTVFAEAAAMEAYAPLPAPAWAPGTLPANTENYAVREDNPVRRTSEQPVSTFSIDVDTGSYANVRRMLHDGTRPPVDAVRAEEMINYFRYGHRAPESLDVPFRVTTELAPAPWNGRRQLLMIGIKGYDVPKATLPPANLVLLIDTSGSMNTPDKLPLLKQSMKQLVNQLRPQDHVSIVVYAGSAGLVLAPTSGDRSGEILAALERLQAGGSTNGGDGIRLAYAMAKQGYVQGGVNRVILATDGDFNVGTVDQGALETLVADQRKAGIALTTLGFGSGNYNDALAEQLADIGDGNHAYIDSLAEARKVLVQEMGSTLLTIARDVKIQVEFNPALVAEYRLVGYENRVLRNEDFANDKVDAGDIGAGHEVTALYEITPVGSGAEQLSALRYGAASAPAGAKPGETRTEEVAHLRLRYKRPGEDDSRLITTPVARSSLRATPSDTLRFAATVAAYADALRGGSRIGDWGWDEILRNAREVQDGKPQRAEFVGLVETAQALVDADAREAMVAE